MTESAKKKLQLLRDECDDALNSGVMSPTQAQRISRVVNAALDAAYSVGYVDSNVGAVMELVAQVREAYENGRLAEREECALLAEKILADDAADAIRARVERS